MLSELLEKNAKIGSVESIAYVAYWLSSGISTLDDLFKCVKGHPNIRISEIKPILALFEAMHLITLDNAGIIDSKLHFNSTDVESFIEWFSPQYVTYVIKTNIINLNGVYYSLVTMKYTLNSTAITTKHASYRNLLIELGIIEYNHDGTYSIIHLLDDEILKNRDKKTSESELLDNLEKQRAQGEDGENFVLGFEKNRIKNENLINRIKRISIIDVSAGFDIVSFNNDDSNTFDRFIEVKTYIGKPHFYWSKNEIDKARLMGDAYFIYLVDYQKINTNGYNPLCISNPIKNIIQSTQWTKTPESFLVELLSFDTENNKTQLSFHQKNVDTSEQQITNDENDMRIIEELVNTAIQLGVEYFNSLEIILNRVNDKNKGTFKRYLDSLRFKTIKSGIHVSADSNNNRTNNEIG